MNSKANSESADDCALSSQNLTDRSVAPSLRKCGYISLPENVPGKFAKY